VTNARAFYTTRAAAGATGTRLSLRPLIFEGFGSANLGRIAPRGCGGVFDERECHISQLSSSAKADDPVFQSVGDGNEKLRRTGYPAFAGYDGPLSSSAVHRCCSLALVVTTERLFDS
jgi:hypothetical protein